MPSSTSKATPSPSPTDYVQPSEARSKQVLLEQGSATWHAWRQQRMTASESAVVMGCAPDWWSISTPDQLRAYKNGGPAPGGQRVRSTDAQRWAYHGSHSAGERCRASMFRARSLRRISGRIRPRVRSLVRDQGAARYPVEDLPPCHERRCAGLCEMAVGSPSLLRAGRLRNLPLYRRSE